MKGYQSVNVLTDDGLLSGYLVEQNDDEITISIATDAGKPRKISMDDVVGVKELEKSTMPEGLANLCGSRDGFLDLAKFVIDINRGGPKLLRQLKRKAKVE